MNLLKKPIVSIILFISLLVFVYMWYNIRSSNKLYKDKIYLLEQENNRLTDIKNTYIASLQSSMDSIISLNDSLNVDIEKTNYKIKILKYKSSVSKMKLDSISEKLNMVSDKINDIKLNQYSKSNDDLIRSLKNKLK